MVSVVIASYRRPTELIRCVASVQAAAQVSDEPVEVIVAASGYGPTELGQLTATDVSVLQMEHRVFVSAARNRGASVARGEYLLFLDDDNIVAADCIMPLVRCLSEHTQVSLVGPVTYYMDDPNRIWCAGVTRSAILGRTIFRTELPTPVPDIVPTDDYPNCFMLRANQFAAIGGFDEELFPMHYEESDLAARLHNANFGSAACVTASRAWHSTRIRLTGRLRLYDPERAFMIARGRCLFTARHQGLSAWIFYVFVAQFLFGGGYVIAALMTRDSKSLQIVKSYVRGAWDGLRKGIQLRRQRHRHAEII